MFKEKNRGNQADFAEKGGEQIDPNFVRATENFERVIKPGIDAYLPKLMAFTEEILQTIERTDQNAVFIGRDGRWLFYIAKLIVGHRNRALADKVKFIDVGRGYIRENADARGPTRQEIRGNEYNNYFKNLSININNSFLVDVGFQGTIINDIRRATGTKNKNDVLLVKSDLKINPEIVNPEIKGFYEGKTSPEHDENMKMGYFVEGLPQTILPVEELQAARAGQVPKYSAVADDHAVFLARMSYGYFKKSIDKAYKSDRAAQAE